MKFILQHSKGKVLDCGGFEGDVHRFIKEKFPDIVSVDKDSQADYVADFNKDKLPFPNKKFDTIVAGEIIEHIVELPFFIKECRRVLKDDGVLIITTPNATGLSSFLGGTIDRYNPRHVLMFNKGTLKKFMEQLGFICEVTWANSFDIYHYPLWVRPFKYLTLFYPPWHLHVCAICKKSSKR